MPTCTCRRRRTAPRRRDAGAVPRPDGVEPVGPGPLDAGRRCQALAHVGEGTWSTSGRWRRNRPPRWLGAYPATKFAVAAYSQQLRLELGPQGLHVLAGLSRSHPADSDPRLYPLEGAGSIFPTVLAGPGAGVKAPGPFRRSKALRSSFGRANFVGRSWFCPVPRPAVVRHLPSSSLAWAIGSCCGKHREG